VNTEIKTMSNVKGTKKIEAIVSERGNGFPDVGAYVPGDDGGLYRVLSFSGPIHTGPSGASNYIHATVELADWDDCEDGEEFPAMASLLDDEEASDESASGADEDGDCPECGHPADNSSGHGTCDHACHYCT
jgi:hypothetical protein